MELFTGFLYVLEITAIFILLIVLFYLNFKGTSNEDVQRQPTSYYIILIGVFLGPTWYAEKEWFLIGIRRRKTMSSSWLEIRILNACKCRCFLNLILLGLNLLKTLQPPVFPIAVWGTFPADWFARTFPKWLISFFVCCLGNKDPAWQRIDLSQERLRPEVIFATKSRRCATHLATPTAGCPSERQCLPR